MTNTDPLWTQYQANLKWTNPFLQAAKTSGTIKYSPTATDNTGTSLTFNDWGPKTTESDFHKEQFDDHVKKIEERLKGVKITCNLPRKKKSPYTMWNLLKWALTLSAVATAIGSLI